MNYTRDQAPCLNCDDRHLNCHSQCEHYKNFKQRIEDKKTKIKIQKEKDEMLTSASIAGIKRMKRSRK